MFHRVNKKGAIYLASLIALMVLSCANNSINIEVICNDVFVSLGKCKFEPMCFFEMAKCKYLPLKGRLPVSYISADCGISIKMFNPPIYRLFLKSHKYSNSETDSLSEEFIPVNLFVGSIIFNGIEISSESRYEATKNAIEKMGMEVEEDPSFRGSGKSFTVYQGQNIILSVYEWKVDMIGAIEFSNPSSKN